MFRVRKSIKRGLLVLSFALILALYFSVGSFASKPYQVRLNYDGAVSEHETKSKTVGEFLKEYGIELPESARMNATYETRTRDGLEVIISTKKNITLAVAGKEQTVETYQYQTKAVLREAGVKVDDWSHVTPGKDGLVKDGDRITVDLYEVIQDLQTEKIPFEKQTKEDPNMIKGQKAVTQKGEEGVRRNVYEVQLINGEKTTSKLVKTEVVKEPVPEITSIGTMNNSIPGVGTFSKKLTLTGTAYDASFESNGHWGAVTALGTPLRAGVVAVDPSVIPLGSRLYIECDGFADYGIAVAEDTGSAIIGNRIDLYYANPQTCDNFGVREVTVYVLD